MEEVLLRSLQIVAKWVVLLELSYWKQAAYKAGKISVKKIRKIEVHSVAKTISKITQGTKDHSFGQIKVGIAKRVMMYSAVWLYQIFISSMASNYTSQ